MTLRDITRNSSVWVMCFFFIAGYLTSLGLSSLVGPDARAAVQVEPSLRETGKYEYTAPLLLCPTYESTDLTESASLKSGVQNIVDSAISKGSASNVSVYIRGFRGKWVGINENETFVPASLLKVPLLIAYFKEAEGDPTILKRVVTYDGSFDDNQAEEFRGASDIKPGSYTILQLLTSMIENSDNNASKLLDANIDPRVLASVYTDLGLQIPTSDKPQVQVISAKQYSYFFRILYNSTYLTPEYSEKALQMLVVADFPQGIEATVPKGTDVANKFGERTVYTPQGDVTERDLHDCGIVYAKSGPYVLCIMTKGKNFNDLINVMQSIGKFVYNEGTQISQ